MPSYLLRFITRTEDFVIAIGWITSNFVSLFHFFLKNLTSLCVAVLIAKIFMTLISEIMISLYYLHALMIIPLVSFRNSRSQLVRCNTVNEWVNWFVVDKGDKINWGRMWDNKCDCVKQMLNRTHVTGCIEHRFNHTSLLRLHNDNVFIRLPIQSPVKHLR